MKVIIKRTDDDFAMEAKNEDGNIITMDGPPNLGGHNSGFRPTQLLLAAVGGCSAIDVVMILKKQKQRIDSFEIEVDGEKEAVEEYSLFRNIVIHFKLKGEIELEKAERAVQLSIDKYCSVSKTLEPTAKITYKVSVN
ncbi:MAG: OsmC family protein [Bacteroidia bacterium]|jgi:putative redox protein|nr:OsmC family protein [Bacteroidia bacterium]